MLVRVTNDGVKKVEPIDPKVFFDNFWDGLPSEHRNQWLRDAVSDFEDNFDNLLLEYNLTLSDINYQRVLLLGLAKDGMPEHIFKEMHRSLVGEGLLELLCLRYSQILDYLETKTNEGK